MKKEILDFIHYGLKTVDLANLNREHLVNCFEELEKENAELKKSCDETQELLDKQIEATFKLDKENAELKEQQFSLRNERNTFLAQNEQYEKDLIDFNETLTKAKELLAKWVELFKPKSETALPTPIQVDTEQFLSEVEK